MISIKSTVTNRLFPDFYLSKRSFSQCGEDLIVQYLLKSNNIYRPRYIDIGTHHPVIINNSYLFYKEKSNGLLIEPNPEMISIINKFRPNDTLLTLGVANKNGNLDYFKMSSSTLNSFSLKNTINSQKTGYFGEQHIVEKVSVPVISINSLLKKWWNSGFDFMSIDIEGLEYDVLCSMDFRTFRPKVLCIETLSINSQGKEKKNDDLINLIQGKDYNLYADTHLNSIFVDKALFGN